MRCRPVLYSQFLYRSQFPVLLPTHFPWQLPPGHHSFVGGEWTHSSSATYSHYRLRINFLGGRVGIPWSVLKLKQTALSERTAGPHSSSQICRKKRRRLMNRGKDSNWLWGQRELVGIKTSRLCAQKSSSRATWPTFSAMEHSRETEGNETIFTRRK